MKASNPDRQARLRKTLLKYGIILGIAVAYGIFVRLVGFGIPCLFYEITGLRCPGCGVTHMLLALSRLDLAAAFRCNPFLFVTGPFLLAFLALCEVRYVRTGSRRLGRGEILGWVELILAIAYGIARNIFPI